MMTSRERDEGHGEKTEEVACFLMKINGDSRTTQRGGLGSVVNV